MEGADIANRLNNRQSLQSLLPEGFEKDYRAVVVMRPWGIQSVSMGRTVLAGRQDENGNIPERSQTSTR
jgi:hypothetical protein